MRHPLMMALMMASAFAYERPTLEIKATGKDWLLQPDPRLSPAVAELVQLDNQTIALTNGLLARVFAVSPFFATWDITTTSGSAIRGISDEATVSLDGRTYTVGGAYPLLENGTACPLPDGVGPSNNCATAYLNRSHPYAADASAFQYAAHWTSLPTAPFPWEPARHAADMPWPPLGLRLSVNMTAPADCAPAHRGVVVTLHYEMYHPLPGGIGIDWGYTDNALGERMPVLPEGLECSQQQLQEIYRQLQVCNSLGLTVIVQVTHELWMHVNAGIRGNDGSDSGYFEPDLPGCSIDAVAAMRIGICVPDGVDISLAADAMEPLICPGVDAPEHGAQGDVVNQAAFWRLWNVLPEAGEVLQHPADTAEDAEPEGMEPAEGVEPEEPLFLQDGAPESAEGACTQTANGTEYISGIFILVRKKRIDRPGKSQSTLVVVGFVSLRRHHMQYPSGHHWALATTTDSTCTQSYSPHGLHW
jgi:hypothetical protein